MPDLPDYLTGFNPVLAESASILALLAIAVAADLVVKRILIRSLRAFTHRTRIHWDDTLLEHKVFSRLAKLVPGLIIFLGIELITGLPDKLVALVKDVAVAYLILMLTLTLTAILAAANAIYENYPIARQRPLKGVVQLLQILTYLIGGVLIVSALINRSPLLLLSGVGAMTAILLLVFKDTILGLVASVQLTANDMMQVGDWIEMPQYGADGDVVDIALLTVKVQNWDKTITTIPTYKLIAESFRNWRGMSASGGRRIKRPLYIDQGSIRFLSAAEVEYFTHFALLKDYISDKEQELADYNAQLPYAVENEVNQRRLTNLGTFRAYARNYLRNHPRIHHEGMTLMVRQLPPGAEGLPLEIYCFTNTTEWLEYERIQADIFDHLLAMAPAFGLRIFQLPAGADLAALRYTTETADERRTPDHQPRRHTAG